MKLQWIFLVCAAMLCLLTGCTLPMAVSEVLQQPEGAKIYTRYNLWYTNPAEIASRNIQQGRQLTAGSEVSAVYADENTLRIRDAAGNEYTIFFDAAIHLFTMRQFIRQYLTLTPPEKEFADVRESMRQHVFRGEVVPGMNRAEVLAAYGPPVTSRTPDLGNDSWIYWISPKETIRVVFRDDIVRNVLNTNR